MQVTDPSEYNKLTLANLNYIMDSQVREHIVEPPADHPGCVVTNYSSPHHGRPQVRFQGRKYYIGIIISGLRGQRARDPGFNIQNGGECSHLCHYPPCVNVDHIVLEAGDVNKSRACCLMYGHLDGFKCPHRPTCFNCASLYN